MVTLADDIEKDGSTRKTARDIAIADSSFQGPYGVDHRARAVAEDLLLTDAVGALDADAEAWALAWQSAADQMNQYAKYLAEQDRDADYEIRYQAWLSSGYTDYETGQVIRYGPRPQPGNVSEPNAAPKPLGKSFDPVSAFAKYYQSGINWYCYHVDSPTV